jgi:hypothetical protein
MSSASSEAAKKEGWLWRLSYRPGDNLGPPGWVIFMTLLIFLASEAIIAPLLITAGASIIHPHHAVDFNNSDVTQFFYLLVAEGLLALSAIYIVKKRGLKLSIIGLGRRFKLRDIGWAAIGFVAVIVLLIIASGLVNLFSPSINNQQQNVGFNDISGSTNSILAFIALVILPPLGEETLMRGYLFSGLRKFWRFVPAVLVTSLLFAAPHLLEANSGVLWAAGIDTFLLSLVLCFLRERSGALYAGMMVHMLNNLIAFGVHFK